jgi:hypothetical protein
MPTVAAVTAWAGAEIETRHGDAGCEQSRAFESCGFTGCACRAGCFFRQQQQLPSQCPIQHWQRPSLRPVEPAALPHAGWPGSPHEAPHWQIAQAQLAVGIPPANANGSIAQTSPVLKWRRNPRIGELPNICVTLAVRLGNVEPKIRLSYPKYTTGLPSPGKRNVKFPPFSLIGWGCRAKLGFMRETGFLAGGATFYAEKSSLESTKLRRQLLRGIRPDGSHASSAHHGHVHQPHAQTHKQRDCDDSRNHIHDKCESTAHKTPPPRSRASHVPRLNEGSMFRPLKRVATSV